MKIHERVKREATQSKEIELFLTHEQYILLSAQGDKIDTDSGMIFKKFIGQQRMVVLPGGKPEPIIVGTAMMVSSLGMEKSKRFSMSGTIGSFGERLLSKINGGRNTGKRVEATSEPES